MTFVHPLLLGGLALVGIPVLIHLIMQQKPKRLPFPAFRFLLQKHRSNQRTLRLRHLLLLLLRVAVIAALALALARPKLSGSHVLPALTGDRPVHAVILVDTSASMDYGGAGKSWLDEARRRALEVLDDLPDGSRVAVLDSGEAGGEWSPSPSLARERLAALRVRYGNASLTSQVGQAYRLFAELDREEEGGGEPPPKALYVFSDRTRASWDEAAARDLRHPPDLAAVFVDVGADNAPDVAVVEVKPERTAFWPGESVTINVTVRANAVDADTEIVCLFDGETAGERRPLKLAPGKGEVVVFRRATAGGDVRPGQALGEGLHQVEVRLGGNDALMYDNAGFATFRVLGGRRALVLTDDPGRDGPEWSRRLGGTFQPEARDAADVARLDLSPYAVIFLAHLSQPREELWQRLEAYASAGGGVAVLPGGQGRRPDVGAYGSEAALKVLPRRLARDVASEDKDGALWREFVADPQRLARHPFLAPFRRWRDAGNVHFFVDEAARPAAYRFWKVEPEGDGSDVIATYADRDRSPALLERVVGRGKVLLLTTPLEPRHDPKDVPWTNYFGVNSSFFLVLTNLMAGYLAGDADEAPLNFVAGQTAVLPVPARPFVPRYLLVGPGVTGAEADLPRLAEQTEMRVTGADAPGHFALLDGDGKRHAAFSVGVHPDECLLERVPVEQIEALFGEGTVLPAERARRVRDQVQARWAQPVEAAPALLVLLLLAVAAEPLLANRFYGRREVGQAAGLSPTS